MLVPLPLFHTCSNSNQPAEAFLTPWLSHNSPCWRCVHPNGEVEAAVGPKLVCLPPCGAAVLEIPQTWGKRKCQLLTVLPTHTALSPSAASSALWCPQRLTSNYKRMGGEWEWGWILTNWPYDFLHVFPAKHLGKCWYSFSSPSAGHRLSPRAPHQCEPSLPFPCPFLPSLNRAS